MAETLHIKRVAVIGAGALGRTLAVRASASGFSTIIEDVLPSKLRDARAAAVEAARDPQESGARALTFATCVEDAVREADLILDSVPDELESKLEIFSLLDRMAPPRSIFHTPTEVLSIADLASCTYRPERCLAFTPPLFLAHDPASGGAGQPSGLVRVHRTSLTDPEVLQAVLGFWERMGFSPSAQLDAAEPELNRTR